MATTYRLDIRYVPEQGVNSLRRFGQLKDSLEKAGFSVSDASVFDDAMRVAITVVSQDGGRNELKLLALVSATGTIGRFSCRDADRIEQASGSAESETALV